VDVPENSWYINFVLWAVENGITKGMDDTHFGPDVNVTRAQVVTFLYAAAGKPEPKTTVNPFEDVAETDWFYKAVLWAVENGITNGMDATHFAPNNTCVREQVVTFLYAAAGKPETTASVNFTDVAPGDWYYAPVAWAVENGITSGMGDGTFGIGATCTRAQVVTFLLSAYAA
jgi:phenylpyruvate tautomerase PptA (4-oxalocrotonate tautomerase family)